MTLGFSDTIFDISKGYTPSGDINNQNKTFTSNGQYQADAGYTGLGVVTVDVPTGEINNQNKTFTSNGQYQADAGYTGLGTVTVNVPNDGMTPEKTAGLCFWLDGDCNTRNGLDRSKKYFQNLVWARPFQESTGSLEYIESNGSSNTWDDNYLMINNYAYYPYMIDNSGCDYTIEAVFKIVNSKSMIFLGMASGSGFSFFMNAENKLQWMVRDSATNTYKTCASSALESNVNYYAYAQLNSTTGAISLTIPALSEVKTDAITSIKNPTSVINAGFATNANTSTAKNGDYVGACKVGMVRVWHRLLTSDELNKNYADCKNRFGVI